ncbi:MAG: DeoR family transcriptional regulator, partial [Staphylococcus epidermidis]|nr:DeoR family transcriptional regulator [Staphylococcus epidermidis]
EMRDLTEAFVGEMTNQLLSQLRFSKMFFSSNGVKDGLAMTSSIEEAYTQQIALSHSLEKYLLIDSSKIGKDDFSSFCELRELNAVLTDNNDLEKKEKIESYVEVIS